MRPLLEEGYVYLAMPPLFKVKKGKKVAYLYSNEELDAFDTEGASVQRYKGLGEMDEEQLWETTMSPDTRRLTRITVDDAEAAERYLSICMGEEVEPRKEFITENAQYAVAL